MSNEKIEVMVELRNGYGDGYGMIYVDGDGNPIVNTARRATKYADGSPMEPWKQKILSAESITLLDGRVNVPVGAIVRIIGPEKNAEASRIRANRYTKNWSNRAFLAMATDEEIIAAMSHENETETYAAMCSLRNRYAPKS